MQTNRLFLKTSPLRLFFLAAIPGAVSMLASSLYGLFDGIFVGQFLGQTPFAALNLAFPFVVINFALADLIGVGSSALIAIRLGQGEEREANNLFTCACLMIVITGLATGLALFLGAPALLGMLGAEGELLDLAVRYLRIYTLFSPITTIVFAMDNYLRICGKIKLSMWLNIGMSLLTVALDLLFLTVFRWGIEGAALAACLGMVVSASVAFSCFLTRKLQLKFCRPRFKGWMIRRIVGCGSPNFLNNVAGRITSIVMNAVLLSRGGEEAVSIYGILMYVGEFVQPLLYGVCDSLQPAVGYNWGAGQIGRVKAIERCCFTAGAVISVVAAALVFIIPGPIASLFAEDPSPAFLETASLALRLYGIGFLIRWFSFAAQSYMIAVDRAVAAAVISVTFSLGFPLLLIAALWSLGLNGLWLNFAGSSLLSGLLSAFVLLRFRKVLKARSFEHHPDPDAEPESAPEAGFVDAPAPGTKPADDPDSEGKPVDAPAPKIKPAEDPAPEAGSEGDLNPEAESADDTASGAGPGTPSE